MRSWMLAMAVAVPGLAGLSRPAGAASGPESARRLFEGSFRSVAEPDEARGEIDKAIDRVVRRMGFFVRGFARSKLRDSTEPCRRMTFDFRGETVAIQCDGKKPAVAPADGTPVRWTSDSGKKLVLVHKVDGRSILQEFRGEKGRRRNLFEIDEAGKVLEVHVAIISDRLPGPIRYRRLFRR